MVTAYIEIVPTDTVKYEIDKPSGHLKVDRPQQFSNVCPTLYGFIPQTYCGVRVAAFGDAPGDPAALEGDGDPLDICVLSEKQFSHGGVLLQAVPVGGLRLIDRNEADDKIVAVLQGDAAYGHCREIGDLPAALIERLEALLPDLQAAAGSRQRHGRDHPHLRRRRGPRGDRAQPRGLPASSTPTSRGGSWRRCGRDDGGEREAEKNKGEGPIDGEHDPCASLTLVQVDGPSRRFSRPPPRSGVR